MSRSISADTSSFTFANRNADTTMQQTHTAVSDTTPSVKARRIGLFLSWFAILFLVFDTVIKLFAMPIAVEPSVGLGYSAAVIPVIGAIELICLVLYLVPRTAFVGAVLWTGYLGGAVATHVRAGSPLLSHTLFPLFIAALLWGGLWLRDRRLRALVAKA